MIGKQMYILDCRSRSNSHKEILANLELLHLYLDLVWGGGSYEDNMNAFISRNWTNMRVKADRGNILPQLISVTMPQNNEHFSYFYLIMLV